MILATKRLTRTRREKRSSIRTDQLDLEATNTEEHNEAIIMLMMPSK